MSSTHQPPAEKTSGLRRELGLVSAGAIVVSNMIGTGIFGATGYLAGDLGRPSLVLAAWMAGGIVALAGCLCYAELGINFPRSGGEYVYLREVWGPIWGFLSGWVSFFAGFSAPIAAGALLFSEYLSHLVPGALVKGPAPLLIGWLHFGWRQWMALAVIVVFAVVNVLGVRLAARVQNALTAVKVATLLGFLALAFAVGHGSSGNFAETAARTSSHGLGAQFAISLIFVMYAYSGWNAATYVAEEVKTPERTLPAALAAGTGIVLVLYLALNAAFIYALPLESLKGVVDVGAAAAIALFGARVGDLFSAVMAASILATVSAMTVVGPRVYYAMAQDGCFFADAARVHRRWHTPTRAVLYQAAASAVMVVVAGFEALAYYIGFALLFFTAFAAAGVFRMRRTAGWKRLPALSWGYPLVPGLFVGSSLWVLAHTLWLRPIEPLWGLLTISFGALLYRWKVRSR